MRRLACLQALAVLLLVACGQGNETPHRVPLLAQPVEVEFDDSGRPLPEFLADRQTVRRGNGEEPQTLDPHLAEGVPANNVLRDLLEGLTTTSADGRIIPGAAHHWDISRDGLVYTFFIDPDGRWSNGEPVTAHDFVWSWQRAVDAETGSPYGKMLAKVVNAAEIRVGRLHAGGTGVKAL